MDIYQKYGGFEFWHECLYGLYLDMFDHPEIAYHFVGVDIKRLSELQTQFLIREIGGPDIYEGADINKVHKHMGITPFQFKIIAASFRGVFEDKGLTKEEVDYIMKFVDSHQRDVVTAKTSLIERIMIPIYKTWGELLGKIFKESSWDMAGDIAEADEEAAREKTTIDQAS